MLSTSSQAPTPQLQPHPVSPDNPIFDQFRGNKWFDRAVDNGMDPMIGALAVSPHHLDSAVKSFLHMERRLKFEHDVRLATGAELSDDPFNGLSWEDAVRIREEFQPHAERTRFHFGRKGSYALAAGLIGLANIGATNAMIQYFDEGKEGAPAAHDDSVLPGTIGSFTIGERTFGIPGFADFPKGHYETTIAVTRDVDTTEEDIEFQQTAESASAENAAAIDLELLGTELEADLTAARAAMSSIAALPNVTKIVATVEGYASDELFSNDSDGLGVPNAELITIAKQRTGIGVEALSIAAQEAGIELDQVFEKSNERVLTADQITELETLATQYGLDRPSLIRGFNLGEIDLDENTTERLKELLPRGVTYSFDVTTAQTTEHLSVTPKTDYIPSEGQFAGLPGEVGLIPTLLLSVGPGILVRFGLEGSLAKRRARRYIRNARQPQ